MPTVVEQGVHLLLVADLAYVAVLVRVFIVHHTLPVARPTPKAANISVPRRRVDHLAVPIHRVLGPSASIDIPRRKCHRTLPVTQR